MPRTHDVGPFFVQFIDLAPKTPLLHTAPTDELDPPYRRSSSWIIRIWRKGVVFGRWRHTGRSEKEALLEAVRGTEDALTTDSIRDNAHRFDEVPDELVV
jgi:hypothetical protein